MVVGVTLLVVAALIVVIWVFIEVKRMKHKLFAIFLIALILFGYLSFTFALKNHNIDLKSASGLIDAGKIYFSWLGSIFGNIESITSYAVKKDWGIENSSVSDKSKGISFD
jgi:predicted membrane channel-forming protein YqfA (hemolysin III family)